MKLLPAVLVFIVLTGCAARQPFAEGEDIVCHMPELPLYLISDPRQLWQTLPAYDDSIHISSANGWVTSDSSYYKQRKQKMGRDERPMYLLQTFTISRHSGAMTVEWEDGFVRGQRTGPCEPATNAKR